MTPNLTSLELDILRKLVNGERVSVTSHLRVRLELMGVIRESAQGIVVTSEGRRLARQQRPTAAADSPTVPVRTARDSRGRRLPFQRKSIF